MNATYEDMLELCRQGKLTPRDDSRKVDQGDIFIAVQGESQNGADYILDAVKAGAQYVIAPDNCKIPETGGFTAIRHADTRKALAELAEARWNTNRSGVSVIGITGTNGKTTSSLLLEKLFESAGYKTGVLGTVDYHWPGFCKAASLTTPGLLSLHEMMRQMDDAGVEFAVMEVSSHSLSQKRIEGISFAGALFTNLTQDHLDFHTDMENYFKAKASLFFELPKKDKPAAINSDDMYGRRLLELFPSAVSYGLHSGIKSKNHLFGRILSSGIKGLHLEMNYNGRKWDLQSPLIGKFNALNLLGVQAIGLQLGFSADQMQCLANFNGVCGRLERIANKRNLNVFVDYAHTPDALINVLQALRGAGFKRIIAVFGCGGNRDRTKRPVMGKAVAEFADVAVLTSDNPRMEDPEAIINDVLPGLQQAKQVIVEKDRKLATKKAIELLTPDDALLIAGKGHENYQLINGKRLHYSDQEIAGELLN